MIVLAFAQMALELAVSWVTFGPDRATKLAVRESRRLRRLARGGS